MPTIFTQTGQDWDTINVGRTMLKNPVPKTAAGISAAKRDGIMSTEKRYGAGTNSSSHSSAAMSVRKLEEAEEFKHSKVDKSLSKAIMQARTAKKMTQKDLATAINEKPQVIAEYENGKAIPNGVIIVKIERKLGCKLPRLRKQMSSATAGVKNPVGRVCVDERRIPGVMTRGGPPKRR